MTLTHLDLDRIEGLAGRLRESGTKNAPRNSNGVYMSICDEAADDITALITRIRELEEALEPFAEAFERRRDFYARRRHADEAIGYANFDKMPDSWPMEKMDFNMGDFRRARTALQRKTP